MNGLTGLMAKIALFIVEAVVSALIGHLGHTVEKQEVTVEDAPRGKCLLATALLGDHYVVLDVEVAGKDVFVGYVGKNK